MVAPSPPERHRPDGAGGRTGSERRRERAAAATLPVLERLRAVPVPVTALAVGALLLGALLLGSWPGGLLLLLVVGALGWITWLVWPRLSTGHRVLRAGVLTVLLVTALARLT
ncbi:DUF6703 family protein [Thalassiella azotivora]